MANIFISYAKKDRTKVEPLAKALKEEGWTVWWDPTIPTGKDFDDVIEEEISKARCIIVIWSKRSVKSKYVKGEAREGLNRDILVPIKIESGIKLPFDFRSIQTLSLINWDGSDNFPGFQKLIGDITRILGDPTFKEKERKRKEEKEQLRRKKAQENAEHVKKTKAKRKAETEAKLWTEEEKLDMATDYENSSQGDKRPLNKAIEKRELSFGTNLKAIIEVVVDRFMKEYGIDLRSDSEAIWRLTKAAERSRSGVSDTELIEINVPFIAEDEKGPKHISLVLTQDEIKNHPLSINDLEG